MRDDRLPRPEGTVLFGVVTDCNNKVEFYVLVLVPRLGASIGSVNFVHLSKNPDRIRINCGSWIGARTVWFEFSLAEFPREILAEDASRAISCTKEQDPEGAMSECSYSNGIRRIDGFAIRGSANTSGLPAIFKDFFQARKINLKCPICFHAAG